MTNTIVITGSSTGLGRATSLLFASKGWTVIATMRNPAKDTELSRVAGISVMPLDVTQPAEIAETAAAAFNNCRLKPTD